MCSPLGRLDALRPHEKAPLTDTAPAAEAFLLERLRAMSPSAKLELVRRLNRGLVGMSVAGIRSRHGALDERELGLRVAALRLPRETMVRVFGWDPQREGY